MAPSTTPEAAHSLSLRRAKPSHPKSAVWGMALRCRSAPPGIAGGGKCPGRCRDRRRGHHRSRPAADPDDRPHFGGHGRRATSATAATGTPPASAASRTASTSPSPAPTATSGAVAASPMTLLQIMHVLRAMPPTRLVISDMRDTTALIGNAKVAGVEFSYDDGHGNADVQFGIEPHGFLSRNVLDCSVPTIDAGPASARGNHRPLRRQRHPGSRAPGAAAP